MTTTETVTTTDEQATEAAPKPVRKTAKARREARKNTKVEQYKDLRGGEDTQVSAPVETVTETEDVPAGDDDGMAAVLAGMATQSAPVVTEAPPAPQAPAAPVAGRVIQRIKVSKIAAHPFNDPSRSQPQPDSPKWVELVASVDRHGVQVPVLLVTREGFLKYRPKLESELPAEAEFVAIYGHRRRAAVIAAPNRDELDAVVDDEVMEDDGDLDAMASENLGREDLSDLAEANQYARYADELGLSQAAIGERLGFDQATISRRLNLLLLAPEIQQAVSEKQIASAVAAQLGAKLPYGPHRSWQKKKERAQLTDERKADQLKAFEFVTRQKWKVEDAAKRVITIRKSLKQAEAEGVEVVDLRQKFGVSNPYQNRVEAEDAITTAREAGELVAAISDYTGELSYYTTSAPEKPKPTDHEQKEKEEQKARSQAQKARREVCAALVKAVPGKDTIYDCLAQQVMLNIGHLGTGSEGWNLAHRFSQEASVGPVAGNKDEYRESAALITDPQQRNVVVWATVVAAFELDASATYKGWGRAALTYVDLLKKKTDWTPTAWEEARIEEAHRKVAAEQARTDDEAERILKGEADPAEAGETPDAEAAELTTPEDVEAEETPTAEEDAGTEPEAPADEHDQATA